MNRYEALKLAVKAHAGQLDKSGQPYILHPIAVAEAVAAHGRNLDVDVEGLVVVALWHDVLEDTDYTNWTPSWFTEEQIAGILAITRQESEPYVDYINRVCEDRYARIVKLADLWHNLQPERQACLPSKEAASLEKRYLKARDQIWGALDYEWWPQGEGKS